MELQQVALTARLFHAAHLCQLPPRLLQQRRRPVCVQPVPGVRWILVACTAAVLLVVPPLD